MRVFVRVEVRNCDSGGLKFSNLRCGFSFDFARIQAASERPRSETANAIAEARGTRAAICVLLLILVRPILIHLALTYLVLTHLIVACVISIRSILIYQARDYFGIEQGAAINQHDVASHAQLRYGSCKSHGVRECGAVRHQCGGSYDPAAVGFDNATVYACSEAEIIRIDDQPPHRDSLAGQPVGEDPALGVFLGSAALRVEHEGGG
jgi:hypothetical protein